MTPTLTLTGWIVAVIYSIRAGGPAAIIRAIRHDKVPRRYKIILAACALPIPGPVDELVAAAVLARIAQLTPPVER
jgi:hypothetical protein